MITRSPQFVSTVPEGLTIVRIAELDAMEETHARVLRFNGDLTVECAELRRQLAAKESQATAGAVDGFFSFHEKQRITRDLGMKCQQLRETRDTLTVQEHLRKVAQEEVGRLNGELETQITAYKASCLREHQKSEQIAHLEGIVGSLNSRLTMREAVISSNGDMFAELHAANSSLSNEARLLREKVVALDNQVADLKAAALARTAR